MTIQQQLFAMLDEMYARFPERDPSWTAKREKAYLQTVIDKSWPALERQRKRFLSKDFDPGNNWWGSMVVKD